MASAKLNQFRKGLDKALSLFYITYMFKKSYVYAFICILSVFASTTTSKAASISPSFSVSPSSTAYAYLENQYIVDYEGADGQVDAYGQYNVYVYTLDISPTLNFSGDGYITGTGIYQINFSPIVPDGWSIRSYDKEYTAVYSNEYISSAYTYSGSLTSSMQIRFWCANLWSMGWTGLGNLKVRFTMYCPTSGSDVEDPNPNLLVNVSGAMKTDSYTIHPSITNENGSLYHVIASALDGSQTSQDLAGLCQTLAQIKAQDLNSYTNILQTLSEIEEWNGIISDWLDAISTDTAYIQDDVQSILSFIQSYLPYLSSINSNVLQILNKLLTMDATQQSEAAAMSQAYANIAQDADEMGSGMNPPKPNVSNSQWDISNNVDSTQLSTFGGLVGMILGNSFITKMLLIVFTGALMGFILYGRKQ